MAKFNKVLEEDSEKTVKGVKFHKGKNGQWYQSKKNRRWERSSSQYNAVVCLKTILDKKMITLPIANALLKSFKEVMDSNGGELVTMETNFKDTVFLRLKIHRKFSPSVMVSTLKSASSRAVKDLSSVDISRGDNVYGKAFWGGGYDFLTEFGRYDDEGLQEFSPRS
jgi:hypothetical protein